MKQVKKVTTSKKFWIVLVLCTVVTISGAIAYGGYLKPDANQQTSSSREPFNLNKRDQQAPKREKKESRKKKSIKDSLGKALSSIESSQNERNTEEAVQSTPDALIHQLATAWSKQYTKEDQRKKETIQKKDQPRKKAKRRAQVPLLENHRKSHKKLIAKHIRFQSEPNVEKRQPKKRSFNETDKNRKVTNFLNTPDSVIRKRSKEKDHSFIENHQNKFSDEENVSSESKEEVSNEEPEQPIEPVEPVEPKPDQTIEEKIAQSKERLYSVNEEANRLNQRLTDLKETIDDVLTLQRDTEQLTTQANRQWQEVENLVTEYNGLSGELRVLLDEEGQIPEVNYDLYHEIYRKLKTKVDEVKVAQGQAKKTTKQIDERIQKAEITQERLDQKQQEYQEIQARVIENNQKTHEAINQAREEAVVSENTENEQETVRQGNQQMNEQNQEVEKSLEKVRETDTQVVIDQAKEKEQSVNKISEEQDTSVDELEEDFKSYPEPELDKENSEQEIETEESEELDETELSEEIDGEEKQVGTVEKEAPIEEIGSEGEMEIE